MESSSLFSVSPVCNHTLCLFADAFFSAALNNPNLRFLLNSFLGNKYFSLCCLPGHFDIWDIFSNMAAGCVELTITYQPSRQQDKAGPQATEAAAAAAAATTAAMAAAKAPATSAVAEPTCDAEEQGLLNKLSELSQQADTAELPIGAPSHEPVNSERRVGRCENPSF